MGKKVGIVTYYGENYGSALQLYALYNQINKLGHDAVVIDYKNKASISANILDKMTKIRRIKSLLLNPKLVKLVGKHTLGVDENVKQKFKEFYSSINFATEGYLFNNRNFSYFVTGSDQVWKLSTPGLHYIYYLRFAPKRKRIAYAPSFGCDKIPSYNRRILKRYLKNFNCISVREESGRDIVYKSIGKSVSRVLDPTMLVGRDFWNEQIMYYDNNYDNDYIIAYFLDETEIGYNVIDKLVAEKNKKVKWVNLGVKCNNKSYEVCDLEPLEFVAAIKNAKYVVTDSYHAMLFSIIFNKKFYIIERNYLTNKSQSDRIYSMLGILNIKNRYIRNITDMECSDVIDYDFVNEVIEREREKSKRYLVSALCGAKE